MIILTIVFLVITVLCTAKFFSDTYEYALWGMGAMACGLLTFLFFLFSMNLQWGTKQLSGYIYSNEDRVGYTVGHLRFSENAGADEQPRFCAQSGSEASNMIKKYSGSGKKVLITIPPFFYFSNNPFACGTTAMKISEVK